MVNSATAGVALESGYDESISGGRRSGDINGAIDHFRDMLRLNPNDNQGIRYLLAGCLLRRGEDAALKLAREFQRANEHVPEIFAGTRPPAPSAEGYVTMGGADEATDYVTECGAAWHRTLGAVAWLTKAVAALPPKRRTRPTAH